MLYLDLVRVLKGEIIQRAIEIPIPNNAGVWMDIKHSPIYDKENNIIGISFNATNIDKQKRTTLKIQDQNEQLRKIAWRQSHEVRGPVATIAGLCELLKRER